jgi:hypothetical protein
MALWVPLPGATAGCIASSQACRSASAGSAFDRRSYSRTSGIKLTACRSMVYKAPMRCIRSDLLILLGQHSLQLRKQRRISIRKGQLFEQVYGVMLTERHLG